MIIIVFFKPDLQMTRNFQRDPGGQTFAHREGTSTPPPARSTLAALRIRYFLSRRLPVSRSPCACTRVRFVRVCEHTTHTCVCKV